MHYAQSIAEEIIDKESKVFNYGYVKLIDYMGSDNRIAEVARISYGQDENDFSKESKEKLIKHLIKNGHTSPFEQVVLTFKIKLPIFVARQWVRHRTARLNEISGRYTELKPEFYVPEHIQKALQVKMTKSMSRSFFEYFELLQDGASKQDARNVLPVATYTEWYWQIDAHNLMHFLKLRLDWHAQFEIREYAKKIAEIFECVCPITFKFFNEEVLLKGVDCSGTKD